MEDVDPFEFESGVILGNPETDVALMSVFEGSSEREQELVNRMCERLSCQEQHDVEVIGSIDPDDEMLDIWNTVRDRFDTELPYQPRTRINLMIQGEDTESPQIVVHPGRSKSACITSFAHGWQAYRDERQKYRLPSLTSKGLRDRISQNENYGMFLLMHHFNQNVHRVMLREQEYLERQEGRPYVMGYPDYCWVGLVSSCMALGWNAARREFDRIFSD